MILSDADSGPWNSGMLLAAPRCILEAGPLEPVSRRPPRSAQVRRETLPDGTVGTPMLTERVLRVVSEEPGSTARDVAEEVGSALPTVSSLLLNLVQQGRAVRTRTLGRWCYHVPQPDAHPLRGHV